MIKLYHSAGTIIKNELHNRKDCFIAWSKIQQWSILAVLLVYLIIKFIGISSTFVSKNSI